MGKMSELDILLRELDEHANVVVQIAADIRSMFTSVPADEEPVDNGWDSVKEQDEYEAKKEEEKVITLDELKARLVAKAREGKSDQVKALLNKYGYNKLSEVDPKDYKSIYEDAEVL